jgi:hypothetical protein
VKIMDLRLELGFLEEKNAKLVHVVNLIYKSLYLVPKLI